MPQINITLAKQPDDKTKDALQLEIAQNMEILPGKNIGNTTISICGGCAMFRNGKPHDGAFIDVRLYKNSPEESKKEFAEKLFSIFKAMLDIEPECIAINFIELPNWASGGRYF